MSTPRTTLPPMAHCSETTKTGKPCNAPATAATGKCAGHSKLGVAANPEANQAKAAASRSHKAALRNRSAAEWLEAELEAQAQAIVKAASDAARDGDWRAGAWLYERVYGKPVERKVELDQGDVATLSGEERARLRARAVARLTLVEDTTNVTADTTATTATVSTTDTTGEAGAA